MISFLGSILHYLKFNYYCCRSKELKTGLSLYYNRIYCNNNSYCFGYWVNSGEILKTNWFFRLLWICEVLYISGAINCIGLIFPRSVESSGPHLAVLALLCIFSIFCLQFKNCITLRHGWLWYMGDADTWVVLTHAETYNPSR